MNFVFGWIGNIAGKGGNASDQNFFLFPQYIHQLLSTIKSSGYVIHVTI